MLDRDRPSHGAALPDRACGRHRALAVLMRFNLTNGLISLSGNLLCAGLITGTGHLDPVVASVSALILCCLANFLVSDRLIFVNHKT